MIGSNDWSSYLCNLIPAKAKHLTLSISFSLLMLIRPLYSSTGPALSQSTPTVTSGGSVVISSSTPVQWQLIGAGQLSQQSATSVTFTAPQIVAKSAILGCPAGPNDTIFNTRVDALPIDPNSTKMLQTALLNTFNIQAGGWSNSYADDTTPTQYMKTFYGSAVYPDFVRPLQGPALKRQMGNNSGTFGWNSAPDHHIVTVRRTDCSFYESYDDYLDGFVRSCQDDSPGCTAQGAIVYRSTDYLAPLASTVDAGTIPLAPVTWRLEDIQGGIGHMGYMTTYLAGILSNSVRWPAMGSAGGCAASTCPNAMPLGSIIRLQSAFNTASVCNSGVAEQDRACNTMMTALKEYGMILADTGSGNSLQVLGDVSRSNDIVNAISSIVNARISMSNFEVVDASSLEVAPNSFQVCPLGVACLNGTNNYEQAQDQSVIVATAADGSVTTVNMAIQGVSVGLGVPSILPIAAGTPGYQIPTWVNGTSDQSVLWSLVSGVGEVTQSGFYTPPSILSGNVPAQATLQGVSNANANAKTMLYVTVLPTSNNPLGSIRIDTGSAVPTIDAIGNSWLPDIGIDGAVSQYGGDYPQWTPNNPAQTIVYESSDLSYGGDLGYTIAVQNGNYKIHLLFGKNTGGFCNTSCGSWLNLGYWDQYSYAPYMLETQGQIQLHSYDFGAQTNYLFQTPGDAWIPAKVTDNLLQVYVRDVTHDVAPYLTPAASPQKYVVVAGMEVLPDSSTPHWAIDTQNQSSINLGQTLLPFYITDWYTGKNDPSWSILSGPSGAAISPQGVLSLNMNTQLSGQPIVIMASDGTHSATVTIATPKPVVSQSSTKVSFGTQLVGKSATPVSVVFSNNGLVPLTFANISLSGANASSFSIVASTCRSSLAPSASCSVSIGFAPVTTGALGANLVVVDSAGNQDVAVIGIGVGAPRLVVNPNAVEFNTQPVNTTSIYHNVKITNMGSAELNNLSIKLLGGNASDFNIILTNCSSSLPVLRSCTVAITFKPKSATTNAATLVVSGSAVSVESVALSGTGVPPARSKREEFR